IGNVARARSHLALIAEQEQRDLLETVILNAETILPSLRRLRFQWIHHDLNLNNLLINPEEPHRLSGVIDLGDMLRAPRIVEVAIASAHQAVKAEEPVTAALDVATAYNSVSPLTTDELVLLRPLMAARLTMAVLFQRAHAV